MNVPKMERLQGLDASSVDPTTENVQFSATIKPIGVLARCALRFWNAEVFADLLGEVVVDFRVPRNGRCSAGGTDEDRMLATFPE